jgi:tryptophan synthase alpha chain
MSPRRAGLVVVGKKRQSRGKLSRALKPAPCPGIRSSIPKARTVVVIWFPRSGDHRSATDFDFQLIKSPQEFADALPSRRARHANRIVGHWMKVESHAETLFRSKGVVECFPVPGAPGSPNLKRRNRPLTLWRMNRIEERFAKLKREGKKAFIVYIGAGDPNLEATRQLALAFDQAGVDVLELGVPFSDPLADGLVNQLAAQRGLESGTTPPKVLRSVAAIRRESQVPVVLYIYFNLIHRVGMEQFINDAAQAGVDGLLVLDLPPEESDNYEFLMKRSGLCHIYLVAPTTPDDRMAAIVKRGSGFIYYISREGVTGMQTKVASNLPEQVAKIRAHTSLPIAVGFGISNPEQAKLVAQEADGCVVGSAVVNQMAQHGEAPDLVARVSAFVKLIAAAVKA